MEETEVLNDGSREGLYYETAHIIDMIEYSYLLFYTPQTPCWKENQEKATVIAGT